MATTAVAPSAAAASGDADSGMSKYYASKIGELSAVSCVRAKGLRRMLTLACFVRLSLAFGGLPIFGCRDTRRCAVGMVRSALHELFIIEIPTLVERMCACSLPGGRMRCGRLSTSRYEQDVLLVHFVYLPLARGCL